MAVTIGIFASLIGLGVSYYIYRKQHANKPLMCPRNAPCDAVINSPQGKTFGHSNAGLGIAYYAAVLFFLICLDMGGKSSIVEVLLLLMTTCGFAFSLYLIQIQRTVIKQWCVWCIVSAVTATILFFCSVFILF
ncbi:MAG TPA: vitamin K epoxide reductase family protein [Candidatus Paceibacterota bacterium]|jgi:uncharacterized membrane protein|nr:vitamin K epoxide reductase family protein [Candidatus Paceibacterota bacterium]